MSSPVVRVILDAVPFCGAEYTPARVNLFYGGNGTGKSAFAAEMRRPGTLTFAEGASPAAYEVCVFDRGYVAQNMRPMKRLPGIVTVSAANSGVRARLEKLGQLLAESRAEGASLKAAFDEVDAKDNAAFTHYAETCWRKTAALRRKFAPALTAQKSAQVFGKNLEFTMPRYGEIGKLRQLCERAYGPVSQVYPQLSFVDPQKLDRLVDRTLLSEPLLSSAHTQFADFMAHLRAADWVRRGHTDYAAAAGDKCPYCQQPLPEDFERRLTESFDAAYEDAVSRLAQFCETYRDAANALYRLLQEQIRACDPTGEYGMYLSHLKLLREQIRSNIAMIRQKISTPAEPVTLAETAPLLQLLNADIEHLNIGIAANNRSVTDRAEMQRECTRRVMEFLAYQLREELAAYQQALSMTGFRRTELEGKMNRQAQAEASLAAQIEALQSKISDTQTAVQQINALLTQCGFRDLSLVPHAQYAGSYSVLREGEPVRYLSEGEQRFLAFLYFYAQLCAEAIGSRRRIAVIDDPLTALDARAAAAVKELLRRLLGDCAAGSGQVAQCFLLTHHAPLLRELLQDSAASGYAASRLVKERGVTKIVPGG